MYKKGRAVAGRGRGQRLASPERLASSHCRFLIWTNISIGAAIYVVLGCEVEGGASGGRGGHRDG